MLVSQLLQLAATLVDRAPVIVEWPLQAAPDAVRDEADLMRCWTSMRSRMKAWARQVSRLESLTAQPTREAIDLAAEMFLADPLSHVWLGIVICQQRRRGLRAMAAVFRNTLDRENQLRRRMARVLLRGQVVPLETSLRLHRLRRSAHRSSQLLLESLAMRYGGAELCDEPAPAPLEPRAPWWPIAARAAAPLRLLAGSLLRDPLIGRLQTSEITTQVVEDVLLRLPSDALCGADATVTPAQLWAGAEQDQQATKLPWATTSRPHYRRRLRIEDRGVRGEG